MALIKFEATDGSVYLDDVAVPLVVSEGEVGPGGTPITINTAGGSMDITWDMFEPAEGELLAVTTTALIEAIEAGIADVYKIPVMSDAVRSQDYLEAPVIVNITSAGPTPEAPAPEETP